jgi:hypothetical protein
MEKVDQKAAWFHRRLYDSIWQNLTPSTTSSVSKQYDTSLGISNIIIIILMMAHIGSNQYTYA